MMKKLSHFSITGICSRKEVFQAPPLGFLFSSRWFVDYLRSTATLRCVNVKWRKKQTLFTPLKPTISNAPSVHNTLVNTTSSKAPPIRRRKNHASSITSFIKQSQQALKKPQTCQHIRCFYSLLAPLINTRLSLSPNFPSRHRTST